MLPATCTQGFIQYCYCEFARPEVQIELHITLKQGFILSFYIKHLKIIFFAPFEIVPSINMV